MPYVALYEHTHVAVVCLHLSLYSVHFHIAKMAQLNAGLALFTLIYSLIRWASAGHLVCGRVRFNIPGASILWGE